MQVKPILEEAEIANLFSSFPNKSHLLLAVSGGPDSLAMMVLAHEFLDAHPSALKFSAATVHHGLRVQALGEAHHVADIAEKLKIQHEILEWQGQKPNSKIQELAREARYNLLFAHALKIGATHVLTAHTLDDQAETILFRMMRGSGMTGLIGMQPHVKHGTIIHSRPLLDVTKQRLVATCDAHKLEYVDDASNSNMQFARVRLRKIMPALAAEGLTAQRFLDLSYRVKRADEALAARVETLWNIGRFHENMYDLKHIVGEPAEIALRYLIKLIKHAYSNLYENANFKHFRLKSIEAALDDFYFALQKGKNFKRSVAGLVLKLNKDGCVFVVADPRAKINSKI